MVAVLDTLTLGFGFDPEIRGILSVLVGVVVLYGSVQLIVSTNTGWRLGALISAAGLMGWMLIMGIVWSVYGIGLVGELPTWTVSEINVGNLEASGVDKVADDPDLTQWKKLPEGTGSRGDAVAAAEAALIGSAEDGSLPENFASASGFITIDTGVNPSSTVAVSEIGGKPRLSDSPNRWDRIRHWVTNSLRLTHPPHYAVVQVQPTKEDNAVFPAPPDPPERDPSEPVYNVIMLRDLGDRRLPSILVTIGSGLAFGVLCFMLHERDQRLKRNLAAAKS